MSSNHLAHRFRYAFYNKQCTERLISTFCKGKENGEAIDAVYSKGIKLFQLNAWHNEPFAWGR